MTVQPDHGAVVAGHLVLQAKDPLAIGVQQAGSDQFRDRPPGGKVWVQRHQGLGPLIACLHPMLDMRTDAGVVDVHEAAGVLAVVVNKLIADPENVHLVSYPRTKSVVLVTVVRSPALCVYSRCRFVIYRSAGLSEA